RRAELVHHLRQAGAHVLVEQRLRSERDDRELLAEESVSGEVVERREQLALREVAAASEDDELAGRPRDRGGVVEGWGVHVPSLSGRTVQRNPVHEADAEARGAAERPAPCPRVPVLVWTDPGSSAGAGMTMRYPAGRPCRQGDRTSGGTPSP